MRDFELLHTLVAWAVALSPYPSPEQLPIVEVVSHEWLVHHACYDIECRVVGWYTDAGIIYIDKAKTDRDDILVHEIVHYLQDVSGKFPLTCAAQIAREREAYNVQNAYLAANGIRRHETLKVMGCKQ